MGLQWAELERRLAGSLGLVASRRDEGVDLMSPAEDYVLQIKASPSRGMRDLRAGLLALATYLDRHPAARGCFVWVVSQLPPRLSREWEQIRAVLRPDVASRISLVAIDAERPRSYLSEQTQRTGTVERVVRESVQGVDRYGREPKWITVAKILMVRFLLGEGPIARGELCAQAGCTLPTLAKAIARIGPAVRHQSNRSVQLREFPRQLWHEVAIFSAPHRGTLAYVDRSGERPDADRLARRLLRTRPPHVALGGVAAARHWDPQFDLRGTPRLDLAVHEPSGDVAPDLEFVRRLDPGLTLAVAGEDAPAPVLVLHQVRRRVALFSPDPAGGMPYADPVEVLLDLGELRLLEQASAMIEHLERAKERAHGGS